MSSKEKAKQVFDLMTTALDKQSWNYKAYPDELRIESNYIGNDISISFHVIVDEERDSIILLSQMPFTICEEKRIDTAIAVCVVNYTFINGSFDFDINDGELRFRLTTNYFDCEVGEEFFMNMIKIALFTIDEYNDKFFALSKGYLSLEDFINGENDE